MFYMIILILCWLYCNEIESHFVMHKSLFLHKKIRNPVILSWRLSTKVKQIVECVNYKPIYTPIYHDYEYISVSQFSGKSYTIYIIGNEILNGTRFKNFYTFVFILYKKYKNIDYTNCNYDLIKEYNLYINANKLAELVIHNIKVYNANLLIALSYQMAFGCTKCRYKYTVATNSYHHMKNHTGEFLAFCTLCIFARIFTCPKAHYIFFLILNYMHISKISTIFKFQSSFSYIDNNLFYLSIFLYFEFLINILRILYSHLKIYELLTFSLFTFKLRFRKVNYFNEYITLLIWYNIIWSYEKMETIFSLLIFIYYNILNVFIILTYFYIWYFTLIPFAFFDKKIIQLLIHFLLNRNLQKSTFKKAEIILNSSNGISRIYHKDYYYEEHLHTS